MTLSSANAFNLDKAKILYSVKMLDPFIARLQLILWCK